MTGRRLLGAALLLSATVLPAQTLAPPYAGTYTAFCFTALRAGSGWLLFGLVWGIAAAGIAFKAVFIERLRIVTTLGYLVMGWLIVPFLGQARASFPDSAFWLLAAGGLSYTAGVAVYMLKGLRWLHPVWHLFVLGGAACHVLSALAVLGAA